MTTTQGVFNETTLLRQRHRADELMFDDRIKQQFIPKINTYNYLRNLQTATINQAFNARPGKDFEIELMWMNACADFSRDDNSCEYGGNEASTNTEVYDLKKRIVKGFTVYDAKFRDNEFERDEAVAKNMLQVDKQIAEEFTQYLIAKLNVFAGVNQVTHGKGVINPTDNTITDIESQNWTAEIMAYFSRVMHLNRFSNAALINGSNLYEAIYVASAKKVDAIGMGDYVLWNNEFPIWWDLFNIDSVNADSDSEDLFSYLINAGAIAMASKNWNPSTPTPNMTDIRWQMPSRFMPGMTYDIFYRNTCVGEDDMSTLGTEYKDTLKHDYKFVLTADMFKNPYGCDAEAKDSDGNIAGENSGILRFRNVDELPSS